MNFSNFKVIIFDLDGTLTKSKSALEAEMSRLLCRLLQTKIVAVTSGGNFPQFQKQFLKNLKCHAAALKNLYLLPTSGASLYVFDSRLRGNDKWQPLYRHSLSRKEKQKIEAAFGKSFRDIQYEHPKKTYGRVIEDRQSQITFSAIGQKAPLQEKIKWNKLDAKKKLRKKIRARLKKYLPGFKITIGGLTSVDITKKGIDKAYGVNQLQKILNIPKKNILFIGDALFRGGNDYEVKRARIKTLQVKDEKETKKISREILRSPGRNVRRITI